MDKLEYIPGDLVKVWINLDIKYQVAEVVGYNPTCQMYILTNWYIEEDRGVISVAEDRIMPIPLTLEILEKNGWVWSDEHEELAFGTAPIAIYPESNYFMVYNLRIKLRYVHQLQHLLFGLGINHEMEV